tara:strand:- start:1744 stop:2352 length:609 start_codon:yes stop_codon:yes gene_type:complete
MYGMKKEYGQPESEEAAQQPPMGADQAPGEAPPADDMEMQYQQMAQSAPQPEKPYTVKAINTLVKQVNDTISSLSDEEIPEITFDAGDAKGGKFDSPLPAELFITLLAIVQLIQMVGGGEFADKYEFDPFTAVTDTDLRKMTAQLKRISKDKKLIESVKEMTEGQEMAGDEGPADTAGAEEPMAPAPTEMNEDDQELASAMA